MKRQGVPYAKRSLAYFVAALAVVLVVVCVVAGLEINHLHNQVDGLNNQLNSFYTTILKGASK